VRDGIFTPHQRLSSDLNLAGRFFQGRHTAGVALQIQEGSVYGVKTSAEFQVELDRFGKGVLGRIAHVLA